MPCTAKKYEDERPELVNDGYPNTDAVLTTRELIRLFRSRGLDLLKLPDGEYDNPLGESTGAGKIFGAAGGVMEAALRTGYWMVNNKNLEDVNLTAVRGVEGIKKTAVQLTPDLSINCVAVSGLSNARKICEELLEGNPNNYQFIEIMTCPGGCINGGGQPRGLELATLQARAKALYTLDGEYKKRSSHENSDVQRLYSTYLKKLGSHEAHHLLHTRYYPNREQEEL